MGKARGFKATRIKNNIVLGIFFFFFARSITKLSIKGPITQIREHSEIASPKENECLSTVPQNTQCVRFRQGLLVFFFAKST
ncbi:hypothetical protein GDO78_002783 [Eleutherodactylus coqui]|uniref:Uncharacterized protein n=1 Tax=Eleutherodactylus coqui TaxID=57060 RepID=A0A8J6K6V1_ELECQ|nr:hypothetical protein GDO78_002783 [Eleutherodactylus coqui]